MNEVLFVVHIELRLGVAYSAGMAEMLIHCGGMIAETVLAICYA